jgi:hypothetical protein
MNRAHLLDSGRVQTASVMKIQALCRGVVVRQLKARQAQQHQAAAILIQVTPVMCCLCCSAFSSIHVLMLHGPCYVLLVVFQSLLRQHQAAEVVEVKRAAAKRQALVNSRKVCC